MPLTFTLDTNCIIALDLGRPEATFIHELVRAHGNGKASVAVVKITASERQKSDDCQDAYLENFAEFETRLKKLGLDGLELLEPMGYWNVGFWDHMLWSDEKMEALERCIHQILFPNKPFLWTDFCAANGIDHRSAAPLHRKWLNAKCDVQAFWSHAYRSRDVYVTSDANFHKQSKLPRLAALSGGRIETPETAVALLRSL